MSYQTTHISQNLEIFSISKDPIIGILGKEQQKFKSLGILRIETFRIN